LIRPLKSQMKLQIILNRAMLQTISAQPKAKLAADKVGKAPKQVKCGECREFVSKGYSCDVCSAWMHADCGRNMNPQDPKNTTRKCSSHFPQPMPENKEEAGPRRPRWRVTPKSNIPPEPKQRRQEETQDHPLFWSSLSDFYFYS
jgi:hypothetical protein